MAVHKKTSTGRTGVSWRIRTNRIGGYRRNRTSFEVEMRLREPFCDLKLHFGTYKTELDANIARDYAALVRISAGEDRATASGFDLDTHPSEFEFEECRELFEHSKASKLRCDEYKGILDLYTQQPPEIRSRNTNCELTKLGKKARKDIAVAIKEFRSNYPHKVLNFRPAETPSDFPKAAPVNGEVHSMPSPSNLKLGLHENRGDGGTPSSNFTGVTVTVEANGFVRTLFAKRFPSSVAEQFSEFAKPRFEKMCQEIFEEFFGDFLEGLGECPVNPLDIPRLLE